MTSGRASLLLRLAVAAGFLHLVLIQPNHPGAMTWGALRLFPLELPALLLGLAALPRGRVSAALRLAIAGVLTLIVTLKTADFAMFTALSRSFNPVADLPLIEAGLRLLAGASGPLLAAAAAAGAVLAIGLVAWATWWATGVWTGLLPRGRAAAAAGAAAVVFAGVAVAQVGQGMGRWSLPVKPPGAAFTARVGVEKARTVSRTLAGLREFRAAAARDPYRDAAGLLSAIDRDTLVVFVESYGRTSLDTPFYAEVHRATLLREEERLRGLGLSMRSGFAVSPTHGGQSWLAHATFANGLKATDQARYAAVLNSGRLSLFHLAQRSGFRTAAVMPQITLEWPEAEGMGFDTVLPAAALGYAGQAFNWVTMPDQFTLSALDRLLRTGTEERPLFAQVALATSHAPWTPVPELVGWDEVGDGRVFDAMAASGDPPEVVWRDEERIRAQYRLAVDYSLSAVLGYAALHADDPPLMIVLGDHQAAGFVGLDERRDVPVHVIGPAHLVDRVAAWGWGEGLVPAPDAAAVPMEDLRAMILDAFSDAAAPEDGT